MVPVLGHGVGMVLGFGFIAIAAVAACYDLATFRIPNVLPALLAALVVPAALLAPTGTPWLAQAALAALLFAAGAVLFHFRLLGGGDVKLLAATTLWIRPDLLPHYLGQVAIMGGGLAISLMMIRSLATASAGLWTRLGTSLPRVLTAGEAVPYGVAIGGAAIATAPSLGLFG